MKVFRNNPTGCNCPGCEMNADEDKGKKSARICVNCGYSFGIQEDIIVSCFSENDLAKDIK